MLLKLHPVAPSQGLRWIRQGLALWWRRPMAFVGLFVLFFVVVSPLMALLPLVGVVLGVAMLPMLTLGFMVAARSASSDGPVHALQLLDGLRTPDKSRRRSQWALCAAYAACSLLAFWLADLADGGTFDALQRALAQVKPGADHAEVDALLADPRLAWGMVVRFGLIALLSVPFWHAPALVHWGGQGLTQALFSSTLAIWRARSAFTLYMLGWSALVMAVSIIVTLLVVLTGSRQWMGWISMPAGLALSAAFYVSLWFSFADCFVREDAVVQAPSSPTAP